MRRPSCDAVATTARRPRARRRASAGSCFYASCLAALAVSCASSGSVDATLADQGAAGAVARDGSAGADSPEGTGGVGAGAGGTSPAAGASPAGGVAGSGGASTGASAGAAGSSGAAGGGGEGGAGDGEGRAGAGGTGGASPQTLSLNILYVHGVDSCDDSRKNAGSSLAKLEGAVNAALVVPIAAYETQHPGVVVVAQSARANLYTAPGSPYHPGGGDSDPLHMDDWGIVGAKGCDSKSQGDPCTTAYEWRYRLREEIDAHFGAAAKNIVLIGHSTGARAAFELAADVGPSGVGTGGWGVADRIAGVVSVHGMVDSLGTSKYDAIGPFNFETLCKDSDFFYDVAGSCANGNGWCEYAARVSSFDAADVVARQKRSLSLISTASCSPSIWSGESDGLIPYDAQGSPYAAGLAMTEAPGSTYRVAHGTTYGAFCHSAITGGQSNSADAVAAATSRIVGWLFDASPRAEVSSSLTTASSIHYGQSTPEYAIHAACAAGDRDGGAEVTGVCHHPGWDDGDDHVIAKTELSEADQAVCDAGFHWAQEHDKDNPHAATFWYKAYSLPPGGGLVSTLDVD